MKLLIFTIMLLGAVTGNAQIVVDKEYGQYQPIEYSLTPKENSKAIWKVQPLDGQSIYSTKQYGVVYAFWGQPGRYQLEATEVIVDFEQDTFDIEQHNAIFTIKGQTPVPNPTPRPDPSPDPEPSPEPSPAVPSDIFDNLGQRIDSKADELGLQYDKRLALSQVFVDVANKMEAPATILTSTAASKFIADGIKAIGIDASWKPVTDLIFADGKARTPMSRQDVIQWYRVVAVGYKGASL